MTFPLKVGDPVVDNRPRRILNPDPADCYNVRGEVVEVDDQGFKVDWTSCDETPGYKVKYAWSWLGQGINRGQGPSMNFKNFISFLADAVIDLPPAARDLPVRLSVSCPETFSQRIVEGNANLVKAVTVTTYKDHVLVHIDWDMA